MTTSRTTPTGIRTPGLPASVAVALFAVALAAASGPARLYAQPGEPGLRDDVEAQYAVTPLRGGIGLLPRDQDRGFTLIELRGEAVYLDGQPEPRSPQELAIVLGADAALILRLTYLDAAAQRAVLGLPALTEAESTGLALSAGAPVVAPSGAPADPEAVEPGERSERRRVVRGDIVRFGGRVRVDSDERVRGDIVVIGGSLTVDGEVNGDITVVGGSARFGPEAIAHREVTVVGGRLTRAPGAEFSRGVNEISFDLIDPDLLDFSGLPRMRWHRPLTPRFRSVDLAGTVIRFAFLGLLGSVVLLVAARSAERVASRVTREPLKAGVVGFLAQSFFVPLLVMGTLLLVVTIIGIPLLVLVPVILVGALATMLVGFTGVARAVGQLMTRSGGGGPWTSVALLWLGLLTVMAVTLLGRGLSVVGGPFQLVAVTLGVVGFVVEYVAWTTGLGAVILNQFGGAAGSVGVLPPPLPDPIMPAAPAPPAPALTTFESAEPSSDAPPVVAPSARSDETSG